MKKTVLLLLSFMMFTMLGAQEDNSKVSMEVSTGWTTFGNSSNPSLFAGGGNSMAQVPSFKAKVGYKGWSLAWGSCSMLTQADSLDEVVGRNVFLVGLSGAYPVVAKFELTVSIEVGMLMQNNSFVYQGSTFSRRQYGVAGDISAGINYRVNEKAYLGLQWDAADFSYPLGKAPALPDGLKANSLTPNLLFGYGFSLVMGVRF